MTDDWDQFPIASIADARGSGRSAGGVGRKLSAQEQNFLNELRGVSRAGSNSLSQYRKAAEVIQRSGLDPYRAKQVQSAIPGEDEGGIALGARINRWLYGVDDEEIADFQYLQGLQSAQVLDRQVEQKGPQTESDAARLKLTEISPFKPREANAEVISDGVLRSRLLQGMAPFYVQWTNRYGLNGLDEQGRSVDQVWKQIHEEAQQNLASARQLRAQGFQGLSPDTIRQYRELQESGATPEELETFILNATGGRGRLSNADEIAGATFVPGVSDQPEYQGFKIRRVK